MQKNNMAQVAKTQKAKQKKQHIISAENRKKLIIAHHQLYHAMFLRGLSLGMSIGAASHSAMQFVRTKISTMDKENPVTKFLLRVNKRSAKYIAKRIMLNKNRDIPVAFTSEQRKKVEARAPQWTNNALKTFNTLATQYKPKQKVVAKPTPVKKPGELPTIAEQKKRVVGVITMVGLIRAKKMQQR